MGKLFRTKVLVTIVVLVGIGSVLFAQGTRPPVDGPSQDALLAVSPRTSSRDPSGGGHRHPHAASRRTTANCRNNESSTVARQLTDAQNALASARARLAGEQARVRQLEEAASRATGQSRRRFSRPSLRRHLRSSSNRDKSSN